MHQYFSICNLPQGTHINKTFDLLHLKVYIVQVKCSEVLSWKIQLTFGVASPIFFQKEIYI